MEIKVMTFNIHHGKGTDKQIDLNRIAEVIEKSDTDIIGLNEVDKHFSKRSHYMDQINRLADKLNMYHSFSSSISLKPKHSTYLRQYGNALLSRYPILDKNTYLFHFIPGFSEGRSILDASIRINNKVVKVHVTHLSLNPFVHRKQTNFIINQSKQYSQPFIVMGDWNMRPGSKAWRKISSHFQDVWHTTGNGDGYTYPSLRPKIRLDYIFASPSLDITDAEIVTDLPEASDHLPLKAHFRF